MYHLVLFFYFIGLGSNLASISPYVLTHFGDQGELIFLAIQFAMPLGSFFGGWISDYTKQLRWLLIFGMVLLVPTQFFLFSFPEEWTITFTLGAIQRFLLSCNYQWLVIATIESKGEASFSKVRASGTLGFLIIQLVLFILTHPNISILKTSSETGRFGAMIYLFTIPFLSQFPLKRHSEEKFQWQEAIQFLKKRDFIVFFGLSFLFYSAYQVTDNYMGRYIQISYGLDSVFLGWMIAVLLEIPFLLIVPKLTHRFGYYFLFWIALAAGGLRFSLFFFSVFDLPKYLVLSFQIPHAILFAGYYMGGIYWFRKNSPPHIYGSIYGLYSILSISLGGMLGNLSCGLLLKNKIGTRILGDYSHYYQSNKGDFALLFLFCAIVFWFLFFLFIGKKNWIEKK